MLRVGRDPIFPVRLDPATKERLAAAAEARGLSLAEAFRQGVEQMLTVTGTAGLALGERDETWDAGAAEAAMTTADQLAAYHFYRDPDGDPETKSSYKLPFATPDPNPHAVWAGITGVAAVLQGGRGGADIPQDEQDRIKGKVGAYYDAARKKYDDDTIVPPWEDNGAACIDNQRALAALEEAIVTAETETLAPADQMPPADGGDTEDSTDDQSTLDQLADVAAQIVHCPDYGDAYWNADTGDVWWIACDGDPYPAQPGGGPDGEDVPAGTPFDEIESMFMAVDGVQSVTIEAETPPAEDAGYVPVLEEGDGGDVNPPADDPGTGTEGVAIGETLVGLQVVRDLPVEAIQPAEADGFHVASPLAVVDGPAADAEEGDSPTPTSDDTEAAEPPPATDGVKFKSTLAVEGIPTDDGRIIEKGALEWRDLPLTLMAIIEDSHGGMPTTATKVCGRIDTIERVETGDDTAQIVGTGVFDTGEVGAEVARLVTEKFLRGVSIDMAVKESDEIYGDDAGDLPEGAVEDPMFGGAFLYIVKRGIVLGATVCPFAAFGEADIEAIAASGTLTRFAMPQVTFDADQQPVSMTLLGTFDVVPADPVPPAPGGDTGQGMIAVYPQPDEATALADPDGNVPAEALHLTLIYFDQMPDMDTLGQLVDEFVAGYSTVTGIVNGAAVFGGETPGAAGEPAETAPDADEGDGGDAAGSDADVPQVLIIDAPGLGELRFDLADALEAAGVTYATDHDFTPHITTDYDDPADFQFDSGLIGKPVTFSALSIISGDDGTRVDVPLGGGLTASAAGMVPVNPPGAWFDYPEEADGDTLEPLHIGTDGRVWGHIAAFSECHIGHPGRCVQPPHHYRAGENDRCAICGDPEKKVDHSRSGYDLFHLGEIETAEGDLIPCGTLTLGTDHPPTDSRVTIAMAQRHYADSGMGAAEVVAYEDNVGIMVAGALRPDLPASKVRELRAAKPSGDWRANRGRREMIACLATNTPGYPVPRQSRLRTDDGEIRELGLVAAGYPDPEMAGTHAPCRDAEIDDLAARVQIPSLLERLRARS